MPRARRNRESSPPQEVKEVEEQQDEMDVDGAHELEFDEPLTWRAGKPIPVADLLRRLRTLYEELQTIQQEDAHRNSTVPKAQELSSPLLLGHKDSGVKAWTVLCIIEMFRILAPDAPYKPSQLKDIFNLFVSTIIPALGSPNDPYNTQHLTALASLVTVKSILLLCDAPGADTLILNLFTNCFDVVSGNIRGGDVDQISKNVEYNMTGMLCALVDESPTLPPGVIDILLAQFLRADPSVLAKKKGDTQTPLPRDVSPAYNMARSVCNTCSDKMVRQIGQYFNAVLIDATETTSTTKPSKSKGKKRTHDESDDESDNGLITPPSESDLGEVSKAHNLLRELWRSCPEVIRNVIPQIEVELGAENLPLRLMAVQTIGDMIAGIGAAGPPPLTPLEPAAYPPQSLDTYGPPDLNSVLLTPAAPYSFSSAYPSGYQAFFERFRDKSATIRSAWATAVARIILTGGGGKGLQHDQETTLLKCFADSLQDHDEKVRISAIDGISEFAFHSISQKLGGFGGVKVEGSILFILVERIRDQKPAVRTRAIELLGRIWGVAAAAITEGSERIRELFGEIPSKILEVMYVNDKELNALLQRVMWESLLPISFPPRPKPSNGDSQRIADSQVLEEKSYDPDTLRAERILTLVRDLGEKAKPVFFSLQQKQPGMAKYMTMLLDNAEKLKGGKGGDKEAKAQVAKLTKAIGAIFPDAAESAKQLEVFANHYDRRNFSLARFCLSPESDYKKVTNAIKELTKRLEQPQGGAPDCLPTFVPFLRSASVLVYNRSHVPAIMEISRTDDKGLGQAAHQILKEIAARTPEVFKVHIQELCESLKKQAPSATTTNDPSAVDSLKACAGFARHFPEELGKERDFYKAMVNFALYGAPPRAAKHAVTVIISSAQKKNMYIKDITKCVKNFKLEQNGVLAQLASLSQLRLLASDETEDLDDSITEIATQVLASPSDDVEDLDSGWADELDDGLSAKLWALKIVVNSLRGHVKDLETHESSEQVKELSSRVFKLLNTLIERDGELSKADNATPKHYRSHLRLAAAKLILKLCCSRVLEKHFSPRDFNRLTKIVQDPLSPVRAAFNVTLKKYLSLGKLPRRFYGLMFLYAFEPIRDTKERTVTFLKSRASAYASAGDQNFEGVLSHYISLLAHHQDFAPDDLEDFVDYTVFYLKIVATEKNLPVLYSVVQKLKSVQDGIDPDKSENLYILSDLIEAVMRYFAEFKGWSLQILPAKPKLPAGIFAAMPSHAMAQEISEKQFLPEEFVDALEGMVKDRMRTKKRRHVDDASKPAKKARTSTAKTPKIEKARKPPKQPKVAKAGKTPKKRAGDAVPSSERRKSSRNSNAKSYAGMADSGSEVEEVEEEEQEEAEQEEQASDVDEEPEANKENEELTSTPLTSDPVPVPAATKKTPRNDKTAASRKRSARAASKKSPPKATKTKTLPTRGKGRTRNAKKERDVMSIPSDSDAELSDAPSELEA
ncbi:hypothetical protein M409DRAFT_57988 [Zasmidium cellare ATCC 36951]|uniref:Sister chromatid cohesion protein n=1 Tax=Zasmidium cellare ATCC 36951 TaxID=1080233 RepID=A0A6A6CBC0_ZASCE|nr:uncharacterized protein M409DRAFT_57988 [Zasmidium cellare ATCC 36951]KAF2162949.1 hypothetical protein M409DRAFT_57988 [Zasmidium cellare ATCC 36951]